MVRKGCPASPSNMMETSIDEGIETEGPECEEDPLLVCTAFQSSRYGQRRHTLSEVSNQPGMAPSAGESERDHGTYQQLQNNLQAFQEQRTLSEAWFGSLSGTVFETCSSSVSIAHFITCILLGETAALQMHVLL